MADNSFKPKPLLGSAQALSMMAISTEQESNVMKQYGVIR
jgi:hypothetical protein